MATADFIARNWIEQIVSYEQSLITDPLLKDILLVKIDQNHFKTARLRAKLMGGWPNFLKYAIARSV
jgi:hypothetical protein